MEASQASKASVGGRPPLSSSEPTKYVGTKVAQSMQQQLMSAADRMNLTMSDVVRQALKNWLTAYQKALPK